MGFILWGKFRLDQLRVNQQLLAQVLDGIERVQLLVLHRSDHHLRIFFLHLGLLLLEGVANVANDKQLALFALKHLLVDVHFKHRALRVLTRPILFFCYYELVKSLASPPFSQQVGQGKHQIRRFKVILVLLVVEVGQEDLLRVHCLLLGVDTQVEDLLQLVVHEDYFYFWLGL